MTRFIAALSTLLLLSAGACKSSPPPEQDDAASGAEQGSTASGDPAVEPSDQSGSDESDHAGAAHQDSAGVQALPKTPNDPSLDIATFAGGCFWCMETPFEDIDGVDRVISGYTGGDQKHPTYEEVGAGTTNHAESVQIYFNPDRVTYQELLDIYWHNINPTQKNGQFVDHGRQYRTVIFYHGPDQQKLAEASKQKLADSGPFDKPIVTQIEPAKTFWKAEEYHQNFYKKSPARYHSYRRGSGRDQFIERVWGDK